MPSSKKRISLVGTSFEEEARAAGFRLIAGLDEVGRGALAGPVVAAAVILDPCAPLPDGLDDSKRLSPAERERIAEELKRTAIAIGIGEVSAEEIDRINILQATRRAMMIALHRLDPRPDYLLIDGMRLPGSGLAQRAIVGGDAISASIAAASVIAKTWRDRLMRECDALYPAYGFASHVGYGTRAHLEALRIHGPCPLHRRSFRGVLQEDSLGKGSCFASR
ncbi:ribonuclease HII [Pyrinomonas methylaliphatogenes]|jgi:ribonuclease HII|uniref:Ribonuclease HII n=1 Tax=Pyrinomonas methylaliphatogenes TaxID=454194 RepID=A0A0B6WWA1_9BACT|nr:ribonuclease HII [Pyrinomonas methylaliphatogenes]MBX5479910.1 ribonuclease HII [Pyrinomonas methylaliphatogenes]CDM64549.1 RNase HII [Pyrinomonas methylaliphatogenes]